MQTASPTPADASQPEPDPPAWLVVLVPLLCLLVSALSVLYSWNKVKCDTFVRIIAAVAAFVLLLALVGRFS